MIAAFFANVIRLIDKSPALGEVEEGSAEVCGFEMKVHGDAIDRWIGVRRTDVGEVFLCSGDDWMKNRDE